MEPRIINVYSIHRDCVRFELDKEYRITNYQEVFHFEEPEDSISRAKLAFNILAKTGELPDILFGDRHLFRD